MAERLDDPQLDDPARQQPQRPVRVALRGRPQAQGDDLRLLFAVQPLEARGQRPRFAFQRPLKPIKHATLTNVFNGLGAARKGVGNLLVGPRRPVGIGLQENLRPAYLLTAPLELADRLSTDLAFLVGESNDVLFLWHVELSRLETSFPIVLMLIRDAALVDGDSAVIER